MAGPRAIRVYTPKKAKKKKKMEIFFFLIVCPGIELHIETHLAQAWQMKGFLEVTPGLNTERSPPEILAEALVGVWVQETLHWQGGQAVAAEGIRATFLGSMASQAQRACA